MALGKMNERGIGTFTRVNLADFNKIIVESTDRTKIIFCGERLYVAV